MGKTCHVSQVYRHLSDVIIFSIDSLIIWPDIQVWASLLHRLNDYVVYLSVWSNIVQCRSANEFILCSNQQMCFKILYGKRNRAHVFKICRPNQRFIYHHMWIIFLMESLFVTNNGDSWETVSIWSSLNIGAIARKCIVHFLEYAYKKTCINSLRLFFCIMLYLAHHASLWSTMVMDRRVTLIWNWALKRCKNMFLMMWST